MVATRRRSAGIVILNTAAVLVIVGSLYDLCVPAMPANHIRFLGNVGPPLRERFAQLDLAMLRSIGGCLLAIGITCLLLINGPIRRRGDGWARGGVLLLIGLAETNNAYRMFPFASPWYGPLSFAALALAGTLLSGNATAKGDSAAPAVPSSIHPSASPPASD
jgi:hypothetical protein